MRRLRSRHPLSGVDAGDVRMNWQVKYALASFAKEGRSRAEHLGGDVIRIVTEDRPDVVAAITAAANVDEATAVGYRNRIEGLDFLCGYQNGRASCRERVCQNVKNWGVGGY